ncbi:MAG: DUF3703 domain-containing protein [Cyclobacteriaceae bacterium]|nr:DUF3703 domain-containing protein [Cyclobacteriaceae bacterium SS2]
MNFYTTIPKGLKSYYEAELYTYREELSKGHYMSAWKHLERAHILGQRYPFAHSHVHWQMLVFGFRIKSAKEVLGQLPRLIFGGVKSFVGKVPVGNPGRANVPALKSFPIDEDLKAMFEQAGV